MKKLILISALLFSFNGWAEDLICTKIDKYNDEWSELTIKDYKATTGLAYMSDGKLKRGIQIDSGEPPLKLAFERVDKYWWFEYMLDSPGRTYEWFLNYDPEENYLHNISGSRDYGICEIK